MAKSKTGVVKEFDPKRVRPFENQPRKRFTGIEELASSIIEVGQLAPGKVRILHDAEKFDVELIDGERRLRACIVAKQPFRAEVDGDCVDEFEQLKKSFALNFNRVDHDVIETANGLDRLRQGGMTQVQMANLTGKSLAWVNQHLSLLKLHPTVQDLMVQSGEENDGRKRLTLSLALLLTSLPHELQVSLADKITRESVSMAAARRMVMKESRAAGHTLASASERDPRKHIGSLTSIIEDLSHRVGMYTDRGSTELSRLMATLDDPTKLRIVIAIEKLVEDLDLLAGSVQGSMSRSKSSRPDLKLRAG